jgi:hypothetical protein
MILTQAHCPFKCRIKIGAIEASQSRNNNRLQVQSTMNQKSFVIDAMLAATAEYSKIRKRLCLI